MDAPHLLRIHLLFASSVLLPMAAPAVAEEAGSRWAILIAVDDYVHARDLKLCGADQRALRAELIEAGFPERQIFLLHDKAEENKYRPFKSNIERQLELILGLVEQGDMVLVAFSGHGVHLEKTSYLCPADGRLDDPQTLISQHWLYERLQRCPAALKLVMVDACRDDARLAGDRSLSAKETADASRQFIKSLDLLPEGILLLNSCAEGEIAKEHEVLGHGVFMHFVLEGLRGKADTDGNSSITIGELARFAASETKLYVAHNFSASQRPKLNGNLTLEVLDFEVSTARQGTLTNSLGMRLKLIPAGEFLMGSTPAQIEQVVRFDAVFKKELADDEQPQHRVRITRPFYFGVHEVTRGQFARFVQAESYRTEAERDGRGGWGWNEAEGTLSGPKREYIWRNTGFAQDDSHPVVNVTWNDAVAFCEWLSAKEGREYRLPTEAEWEFACRAGRTSLWHHGEDPDGLARVGNVADATAKAKLTKYSTSGYINSRDGYVFTAPVGTYESNAFGLHDMHGNVWEWCADWYDAEAYKGRRGVTPDPIVRSASDDRRVLRGGGWGSDAGSARSADRSRITPDIRNSGTGFRVARTE